MTHSPHRLSQNHAAALSDALLGVEGVDSFHPGRFGQIALLFPGERYPGLSLPAPVEGEEQRLEIHLVVTRAGLTDMSGLAERCRSIAAQYFDGAIDITIADVAV